MTDAKDSREVALERFKLIAPLLEPGLDSAELRAKRSEVIAKGMASERTIRRYLQAYREHGFDGLYPKTRGDCGTARAVPQDVLEAAIELKKELPERSIRQVIEILEGEDRIKPGLLRPSTVARQMQLKGLTTKRPQQVKAGFQRFQKEHRNMLWQVDLKYGPYLPDPANPKKNKRTYLVAFIDDYSRLVAHAEFYLDQKLPVLEDCFRKAILKRGLPDKVYVDNGKIFISRWFRIACARLNIRHLTTAPFSPEAKGKIERFMGTVDQFLAEVALAHPRSLRELNEAFGSWLEEGYNHKPHSSLGGKTPAVMFAGDSKPIRFVSAESLQEAFLWEEDRRVDATGCIKYKGKLYDVGPELAGQTIEIRFDPFRDAEVEVWVNGGRIKTAREIKLGASRSVPEEQTKLTPGQSRYLKLLEQKSIERRKKQLGAISFRELGGGDNI